MPFSNTTHEMARNAPLIGSALYLNFISEYGTVIVTTLAILYGVMQLTLRWLEHRALMRKHKEFQHGRQRRKRK